MASVLWTVGARDDLGDLLEFIARDSPGRLVPEYADDSIRELIVGNYRVVYRFRRQQVGIVAIVYGSRDLLRRVSKEPWDFG